MELSARPVPEIPMDAASLAEAVQKENTVNWARLANVLQGVSETEAAYHPGPEAWCANEVLAHMIHGERESQSLIQDLAYSEERVSDGSIGNFDPRVRATVIAYGSLERLADAYQRSQSETVALIAGLPDDFVARKGTFWRLGFGLLQSNRHALEHVSQIAIAVAAARRKCLD